MIGDTSPCCINFGTYSYLEFRARLSQMSVLEGYRLRNETVDIRQAVVCLGVKGTPPLTSVCKGTAVRCMIIIQQHNVLSELKSLTSSNTPLDNKPIF